MNQIIADANVVETEISEALTQVQIQDAITELSSAQMLMVGGGACVVLD